ncbi:hypothetical protein [Escherichia coli IS9]|nr:hypothetical protein [Escherichia coli IS9]
MPGAPELPDMVIIFAINLESVPLILTMALPLPPIYKLLADN